MVTMRAKPGIRDDHLALCPPAEDRGLVPCIPQGKAPKRNVGTPAGTRHRGCQRPARPFTRGREQRQQNGVRGPFHVPQHREARHAVRTWAHGSHHPPRGAGRVTERVNLNVSASLGRPRQALAGCSPAHRRGGPLHPPCPGPSQGRRHWIWGPPEHKQPHSHCAGSGYCPNR